MRVYVASSWRNGYLNAVVRAIRSAGHDVYDFREGPEAFKWSDVCAYPREAWPPLTVRDSLADSRVESAFQRDAAALAVCDACVLVEPSGRSAHLEAGWAAGMMKWLLVYVPEPIQPELMFGYADDIVVSLPDVVHMLNAYDSLDAADDAAGGPGLHRVGGS